MLSRGFYLLHYDAIIVTAPLHFGEK